MTRTQFPEDCKRQGARENSAVLDQLAQRLEGRICVLGIGNRQRGDDAVGSVIAERITPSRGTVVIDAGVAPENHLERAVNADPDTVLMIDAVDFGAAPGALALLDWRNAKEGGLSTHALSLRMLGVYLDARTHANLEVLAVQPADVDVGHNLSRPVSEAANRVHAFFHRRH